MKIRAFYIRNYRSIVDSGWCYLSHDNITALIGQNESGKTSVLESLRSFYEGSITDDVLRSDQTFPEITCILELEDEKLSDLIRIDHIPPGIRKTFEKKREIRLVRKWVDARKNIISLAEPEILEYFEDNAKKEKDTDKHIHQSINELTVQAKTAFHEVEASDKWKEESRTALKNLYEQLENVKKTAARAKKPDDKISAQIEVEKHQVLYHKAEEEFNRKLNLYEERKAGLQSVSEKVSICKAYADVSDQLQRKEREITANAKQIRDLEHQHELTSIEREKKAIHTRLDELTTYRNQLEKDLQDLSYQLKVKRKMATSILSGRNYRDAEEAAILELDEEKKYLTPEEMGMALFSHLPLFEFFEDFGSLLPNKIDLEDLLNENTFCEGYKAAKNFLSIAGLDADFFREKNHRILKQKIENLNGEISIDFQDYWQQNVGKDNKIKINFELEHYDYTEPEKSGKPYLEFWIKDRQERLYPKQRSRGVRWFLSFYLELKATAKENHYNRVMLIDEPGLSLHARAQEDVLKVFEDLKDSMQIIYCTHSPHLIDSSRLYRVMAVQRATEDENSETVIMDPRSLHEASSDTLSPIYSLMGTRLNEQSFISPKNNIVVEDTVTFYYISAMMAISGYQGDVHFIPANGMGQVPMMLNILLGWKLEFGVLIMDGNGAGDTAKLIRRTVFLDREEITNKRVRIMEGFPMIEDLFSTIDFKRFILQQRIGITEHNSQYIAENGLSRVVLATHFNTLLNKENLSLDDFDEDTRQNFTRLFSIIDEMIR